MTTVRTPASGPEDPAPHEHDIRLVATDLEDGVTVQEFMCTGCDEVWFS